MTYLFNCKDKASLKSGQPLDANKKFEGEKENPNSFILKDRGKRTSKLQKCKVEY